MILKWQASPTAGVIGYKVSWGTQSGVYSTTIDVGLVLNYTLSGLPAEGPIYIVVSAYNALAQSVDSAEMVAWSITATGDSGISVFPAGFPAFGGTQFWPQGSNATFNTTLSPGYLMSAISVDGTDIIPVQYSYTFSSISANHTITVSSQAIGYVYPPSSLDLEFEPPFSGVTGLGV